MTIRDPKAIEKRLQDTLSYLQGEGVSPKEIIELINNQLKEKDKGKEEIKIPLSIFKNDVLGSLENIVKYLRENLLLSFKQIAALSNRNEATLAVTYRNAKRKLAEKFVVTEISPYSFPVSILQDRNLSVLENIAAHLKDTFALNYHSVALLLNRDDRTIWTVYQRARKKRK